MNCETKAKLASQLKNGATFGAGAASVGGMLMLLMQDRELAREFGPYFVITLGFLAIGVLFINKAAPLMGQFIETQRHLSEEVGKMAGATQLIASKDDQRARAQELQIAFCATNSELLLEKMTKLEERLSG